MKIYLVRHGETSANKEGIVQGWLDYPLNIKGRQQAEEAARSFTHSVDAVFVSDLKRAQETAEFFKRKYGGKEVPFFTDWRLRERHFGVVQGTQPPHEFWLQERMTEIDEAESNELYALRLDSFLRSLTERSEQLQSVLVIAHGGTVVRLLEMKGKYKQGARIENAAVYELDV